MENITPLIFEEFSLEQATPAMMDRFWSLGWRHFGTDFFRYSISFGEQGQQTIQPLRINLGRFIASKSQRRVLRRNADTEVRFVAASLHPEVCAMFQHHKQRFTSNVPEHLRDFLGAHPGQVTPCTECQVWLDGALVAASFFETTATSTSSVYGLFDPTHAARSLGIFTMLKEMEHALQQGRQFYYSGYATREPSHYDYKKSFVGLEIFDWSRELWLPANA